MDGGGSSQMVGWGELANPSKPTGMRYWRNNIGGGTYFFTVNLAERSGRFWWTISFRLRDALRIVKERHRFHIDSVARPCARHMDVAARRRRLPDAMDVDQIRILPAFAERRAHQRQPAAAGANAEYGNAGIGNTPSATRKIFAATLDYIHYNPVKHGYVTRPSEWPHSSIHRYI